MKTDAILKSDLLDIIFEHKNKMYGAYTLRKFYNNRLYKSLGATLGIVIVLCSFTFIHSKKVELPISYKDSVFTIRSINNDIPKKEIPLEIKKPAAEKLAKTINTDAFTQPIVVNKTNAAAIKDLRSDAVIGTKDIITTTSTFAPIVHPAISKGNDTTNIITIAKSKVDKETPTNFAEVMPSFSGGAEALINFLQRNLNNPQDLNEGETVLVKIKFVVGFDGKLKSFETVQDGGIAFNNEVIRVLKKMPAWNAGKTKGENVSVYFTLPVRFTANAE